MLSFQSLYDAYATAHIPPEPEPMLTAMQLFSKRRRVNDGVATGFERMKACRRALEALDRQGWDRSYHQRQFHEVFLKACSRIFWKTEKAGQFQRDHQRILQLNGWTHLSQVPLLLNCKLTAPNGGSQTMLICARWTGNPRVDSTTV